MLLTVPSGAPLRNPQTGELIGNSPFMNGLIALIMLAFLVTGWCFGIGAGTLRTLTDVIKAMEKAISNLGGLILLLLIISQFIAYFNYTNMATIMAVKMADGLKGANIGPLWLLLGFIFVVAILDLLITGAIAKWAIFAPVFVPVFIQLGVAPESVLAAYRIADSPMNMITPLIALMLPYVVGIFVLWTALFIVWYLLGLPWGL